MIITIDSLDDPRLDDYVGLTDVALRRRTEPERGLYIAESQTVLERALRAGHEPRSVLVAPRWLPSPDERAAELRRVRAQGWALTDQQLASGIRSVAAPLRDGSGGVVAAMNVTVHAHETSVETLTRDHLPLLLQAAGAVSGDFALRSALPVRTVAAS